MSTVAEHLQRLREIASRYHPNMHGLRQNDRDFQFEAILFCGVHLDELEALAAPGAPAPAAQSADMVLVPREPTRAMIDAAVASWAREGAGSASAYRAMIAAAAGAPTKTDSVHEAAPQASEVHRASAPANAPSGEGSA